MSQLLINEPNHQNAIDWLKRQGNPFRNYFARNPDDEVCSIYHVPELYSREREQLLRVVDQYRYTPNTHSEVVPILGNKGAGKPTFCIPSNMAWKVIGNYLSPPVLISATPIF